MLYKADPEITVVYGPTLTQADVARATAGVDRRDPIAVGDALDRFEQNREAAARQ
ncbi:hypothetical protein [Amycolatopsis sp. NPDC059657]|uniref:hypothetical protein n=1 Tax=Amycolatopsis sp. NPDC059657 TaxID=3346899 RepID=UPI00366F9CB3